MEPTAADDVAPEQEQPKQFSKLPTIFNLREIIERCFDEGVKAGFNTFSVGTSLSPVDMPKGEDVKVIQPARKTAQGVLPEREISVEIIRDRRKLADHIALTIVGELKELEMIRKLQPIFRMFPQLANDFSELELANAEDFRKRNIRKEQSENSF